MKRTANQKLDEDKKKLLEDIGTSRKALEARDVSGRGWDREAEQDVALNLLARGPGVHAQWMPRTALLLPLPEAKLQEVGQHQPVPTLLPISPEPQVAQALDQEAWQEDREGQPRPEELSCGKEVRHAAEAWGKRDEVREARGGWVPCCLC